MTIAHHDGFVLLDGVPIGSVERIAYEDATLERARPRTYTGHAVGTFADGGAAFRAFVDALVPTPEQIGCDAGVARWWRRYARRRTAITH